MRSHPTLAPRPQIGCYGIFRFLFFAGQKLFIFYLFLLNRNHSFLLSVLLNRIIYFLSLKGFVYEVDSFFAELIYDEVLFLIYFLVFLFFLRHFFFFFRLISRSDKKLFSTHVIYNRNRTMIFIILTIVKC